MSAVVVEKFRAAPNIPPTASAGCRFSGNSALASLLPYAPPMSSHSSGTAKVRPILQWVFHRNLEAITCELDIASDRSYRVAIVPHWDAVAAVVERIDAPRQALLRHAELAAYLRENGWMLDSHRGDAGRSVA
jgi:hypothetical protein